MSDTGVTVKQDEDGRWLVFLGKPLKKNVHFESQHESTAQQFAARLRERLVSKPTSN